MLWVLVFVGVAVVGVVMVVCYGVWLAHKTSDVLSEVSVLADRGGELAELIGQIQAPQRAWDPADTADLVATVGPRDLVDHDVR